jgi:hypothetical protein
MRAFGLDTASSRRHSALGTRTWWLPSPSSETPNDASELLLPPLPLPLPPPPLLLLPLG